MASMEEIRDSQRRGEVFFDADEKRKRGPRLPPGQVVKLPKPKGK